MRIGEREVNRVSPRDRDIAMVFQDYALYPQMTVRDNLAFGLRRRKTPKADIESRVDRAAEALELGALLDRRPRELSGGQQQRVALGRALVRDPQVFLMDEPLSNLDAKLRVQTRGEIKRLQKEVGTTTVYVTHDQVEAMTMGDRIAVMNDGRLEQAGTPEEVYERPANRFVAGFIGSPGMSFAEVSGEDGGLRGPGLPAPGRRRPAAASSSSGSGPSTCARGATTPGSRARSRAPSPTWRRSAARRSWASTSRAATASSSASRAARASSRATGALRPRARGRAAVRREGGAPSARRSRRGDRRGGAAGGDRRAARRARADARRRGDPGLAARLAAGRRGSSGWPRTAAPTTPRPTASTRSGGSRAGRRCATRSRCRSTTASGRARAATSRSRSRSRARRRTSSPGCGRWARPARPRSRSPTSRARRWPAPPEVVSLGAGEERSVAATKTYTAELAVLARLAAHAGGRGAGLDDGLGATTELAGRRSRAAGGRRAGRGRSHGPSG